MVHYMTEARTITTGLYDTLVHKSVTTKIAKMLCSRVPTTTNSRSHLDQTMSDSKKPMGCLATIKLTKRLRGLRERKNATGSNSKKVVPVPLTPACHSSSQSYKTPKNRGAMLTPVGASDENKENAQSSTGMTCRTASRLNGLGVRGQLKVSLQVENGLLTVNVVEGKQLKFKSGSSRNSYVQVSVSPSDDSMMRYTTKMSYNTSNPHYNETFRHELVPGDDRKRVLIAVWSECGINSVLVGCMSFGVKHLLYKWKNIAGWFYLLNEELGTKKHLKMFSSRQSLSDKKQQPLTPAATSMTLLVTPNPSQYGYGFMVSGSSPSEVSRVLPGSAAEAAGLQPGDIIVRIDTQNVAKSTSSSINRMLEEANETLVMEVQRPGGATTPAGLSLPRPTGSSRSRLAPCSSVSTLNSWVPFDDNNNQKEGIYSCRRSASRSSLNSQRSGCSSISQHTYQSIGSVKRGKEGSSSLKRMASQDSVKGLKRLEPITEELSPSPNKIGNLGCNENEFVYNWKQSRNSCDGESDHGLQYVERHCWDIVANLDRAAIPTKKNVSMIPNASLSTNAADDTELPSFEASMSTFRDDSRATQWETTLQQTCQTTAVSMANTTFLSTCTTETRHLVSFDSAYSFAAANEGCADNTTLNPLQTSSIFVDPNLVAIADRLLSSEEEFAQKMHFGTERFSRPLRHCILLPIEHKTLFQNVEKLVAISEFHVKKLHELKYEGGAGISSAYLSQLALMVDAYTVYCQGLAKALSLLDDLSHNGEFIRFVREPDVPESELNITEFLEKPLLHLEELVFHLSQLVEQMPQTDADFANMRHVLAALRGCYTNLQAEFTLLRDVDSDEDDSDDDEGVEDNDDLQYNDTDQLYQATADMSSNQSMGGSSQPVFTIDREVAELQQRLVFPSNMQPFQIVGPNRHVIYQADLLYVDSWKWAKVQATLLSDQLLLSRKEGEDELVPLMPPILLKDISNWDFDSYHPSEFMLMLDNHDSILESDADAEEARLQSLVFRTLEEDQKSTWRHLLEQRVKTCRAQREYCL